MARVYIHGRPQGQDSWSAAPVNDDKFYIQPFLDSKIGEDVDAVMQTDIWQQNSYYTYIHRKNVFEKSNRPSAYFAITVCFERQICTDVFTLYRLLESVYTQLCLSNFIEKKSDREQFIVSQLKAKEGILNQITNVILQNIEKYISGGLDKLEEIIDTTKGQTKLYSIVDIDSPQFISDCSHYRVLVSPAFISKDQLPVTLKQQIAALKGELAREEDERNKIVADRDRMQLEAEKGQKRNDQLLEENKQLNAQNAALEKQIKNANAQIETEQKKSQSLQKELEQLRIKQKEKSQSYQPQQPTNFHIKEQAAVNGNTSSKEEVIVHEIDELREQYYTTIGRRWRVKNSTLTIIVGIINTFLLIVLLCCVLSVGKSDSQKVPQPDYSSAIIDIGGYNGENTLHLETPYKLELKGVKNEISKEYIWEIKGAPTDVNANVFSVKEAGKIVILCKDKNNKTIQQRTIEAK